MELTMAESVAEPPAEAGPIRFVWEDGNGQRTALISTTNSTTTSPTERFIPLQKIEEHRRRPPHAHRIIPPLNPNAPPMPPQRLNNNPPSGSLSIGNLRGGRVTVLGITEETILPGTTKDP